MKPPFATDNRHARSGPKKPPELSIQEPKGGDTVRGMLPAPLEESATTARPLRARRRMNGIGMLVVLLAAGVASCGSGQRQDVTESEGSFPVSIVSADFPSKQALAQNTNLTLAVQNSGDKTIPNLSITIFTTSNASTQQSGSASTGTTNTGTTGTTGTTNTTAGSAAPTGGLPQAQGAFSIRSDEPGLAIPFRPVWILESGFPKLEGETASAGAEAAQTNTYAFGPLRPNATKRIVWNVTPVQGGTFTVHYRVAAGLQGKAKAVTADGSVPQGEFVVRISTKAPQTRVNDSGQVVPIKPNSIIGQAGNREQKSELKGQ
jgi:hypothetical protein